MINLHRLFSAMVIFVSGMIEGMASCGGVVNHCPSKV